MLAALKLHNSNYFCLFLSLLSVPSFVSFLTVCPGLVDALRCLQWLLWLACLSVLDSHSLDSVGQELISRERHEHSHPSRGGHSRHLIPGHGCGLRVSNTSEHTRSVHCSHFMPPHFLPSFILVYHLWPLYSLRPSCFCSIPSFSSFNTPPPPCLHADKAKGFCGLWKRGPPSVCSNAPFRLAIDYIHDYSQLRSTSANVISAVNVGLCAVCLFKTIAEDAHSVISRDSFLML